MFNISGFIDQAMSKLGALDEAINRSTFGRVFRLDGCGHVSSFFLLVIFTSQILSQVFTYLFSRCPWYDVYNLHHDS